LGGSGGAAFGIELPIGERLALDLRLDAHAGTERYGADWQPTWGGGVRIGLAR
jgi:hypothetical protein